MNNKLRTLIIAVIMMITVSLFVSTNDSLQQTFSLIIFIFICHFYLTKHYDDIQEISRDMSQKVLNTFGIGEKSIYSDSIKKVQLKYKQEPVMQDLIYQDIHQQQQQDTVNQRNLYTNLSSYNYEDQRINQQLQRFVPNKSIRAQNKLATNMKFFNDEWNDEFLREEQRCWYEETDTNCY